MPASFVPRWRFSLGLSGSLLLVFIVQPVQHAIGHDEPIEWNVAFSCPIAELAGTLTLPHPDEKADPKAPPKRYPCVVIIGGSLSHTRDGGLARVGAPKREALVRLAHALADCGYASLRYDKVNHGRSRAKMGWTGSYADESAVAAAAIKFARARKDLGPVIAAGESAGGYLACLAAKDGTIADAYVFLGAHCGPGEAIYEYNFEPLVAHARSSPAARAWIEQDLRHELALGRHYKSMFAAAEKGERQFELVDGDFRKTIDLRRRQEELKWPPDDQFRFIQVPALALAGERDLNVPPGHAAKIVERIRQAGNHACTCVVIPGADHSFQTTPDSAAERFRERHSFESFKRKNEPAFYRELVAWLDQNVPKLDPARQPPSRVIPEPFAKRAMKATERRPRTDSSPERVYLAPGVQIVENIMDGAATAGVETLEGRIGPLLQAQDSQAHFIDMPAGMYCEEHPHSSESIIYTVRGKWVLCSDGRRQVMKPGSLFHFAVNTPTGYEVPFPEDAYILIFKGKRSLGTEKEFVKYLYGLAERLKKEEQAGVPYHMKSLPANHPAVRFAKVVNPAYDPKAGK
jgi:pimeloyl-ACP methyl ester carboxylesterase/quercetin dioxygenase-like cupin family protein